MMKNVLYSEQSGIQVRCDMWMEDIKKSNNWEILERSGIKIVVLVMQFQNMRYQVICWWMHGIYLLIHPAKFTEGRKADSRTQTEIPFYIQLLGFHGEGQRCSSKETTFFFFLPELIKIGDSMEFSIKSHPYFRGVLGG